MPETITIDGLTVLADRPAAAERPPHPPVLFVHGYFADASLFEDWLPFFAARGFPAYAVNLRGRAGSRPTPKLGAVSIADFVDDATRVARALEQRASKPFVVGHSMGGLIAQKLAEAGAVRAAVLLNPAPPRGISVMTPRLAMKQVKYLPTILTSRVLEPDREDLREIVLNRIPGDQQDALLRRFIGDSGRAARDMSIVGVPVDPKRIAIPMFVVASEEDRFIPRHIGERVAAKYGVPIRILPAHAHMSIKEPGWESIADLIARWLSER